MAIIDKERLAAGSRAVPGPMRLSAQGASIAASMTFVVILGILPLIELAAVAFGLDPHFRSSRLGLEASIGTALDATTLHSILRSGGFATVTSVLQFGVALFAVRYLFSSSLRVHRLLFLIVVPLSITPIAASLMWKSLMDYQFGLLNQSIVGMGLQRIPWLSTLPVSYPPAGMGFSEINWGQVSILVADSWLWIPFLIGGQLLAFSRVPRRLLDAAHLEGASTAQAFWRLVCPLSLPYLVLLFFLRFVDSYRAFDNAWAFFGEQTPIAHFTTRVYALGYLSRDYAAAAILAVVGTLLVTPVTTYLLWRIRQVLVGVSHEGRAS
jgi:multiple sugar transport system permease protein